METVVTLMVFYLFFEFFEASWQKAPTLLEMLVRMHRRFHKSIFYFLLLHPTYFFAVWLILQTQLSLPAVLLLFIKTIDITTKLVLMQQVFEKQEVSMTLHELLTAPLEKWMPYVGLAVYPPLVLWALLY